MLIKAIIDEDFVNYKKPSMYIAMPNCSFKCDKDCGRAVCQNSELAHRANIRITAIDLVERYLNNPITKAVVISGLEPFDSPDDLCNLVCTLRDIKKCNDDIVIYTGYTEEELTLDDSGRLENATYNWLKHYPNIYIKFGRFVPGQASHFDETLGVNLASENQYGKKVSYERLQDK